MSSHPSIREAPSQWWRYALIHGGRFDGDYIDIPSFAVTGQTLKYYGETYHVGDMIEGTNMRELFFEESNE